jgi:Putative adhesin
MADHCKNCDAELFMAQRFCRACGASTDYESESAPTQMMPPAPPNLWGTHGAQTAPTQQAPTNPVFTPPVYYQPTVPPAIPQPAPPYPPQERSRKTLIPVIVLIAVLLFGGAIYGGRILIKKIREAVATFTQSSEVVETQTVPLNKGAAVAVKGFNGNITVEGWDNPQAEIRMIRRGNSEEAARAVPVRLDANDNSLVIEEEQGANNSSVSFRIKVPHELGAVTLSTLNGSIRVTDVTGIVIAESTNGSITLSDVAGIAKVETVQGSIKGEINGIAPNQPVSLVTTNGSIDVDFQFDVNAELTASSTHGSVRVDGNDFPGIRVERDRASGGRASGRMGNGGQPLSIATTNGSIRISR